MPLHVHDIAVLSATHPHQRSSLWYLVKNHTCRLLPRPGFDVSRCHKLSNSFPFKLDPSVTCWCQLLCHRWSQAWPPQRGWALCPDVLKACSSVWSNKVCRATWAAKVQVGREVGRLVGATDMHLEQPICTEGLDSILPILLGWFRWNDLRKMGFRMNQAWQNMGKITLLNRTWWLLIAYLLAAVSLSPLVVSDAMNDLFKKRQGVRTRYLRCNSKCAVSRQCRSWLPPRAVQLWVPEICWKHIDINRWGFL